MDVREEYKGLLGSIKGLFAADNKYISYETFKEQNYITGILPREGIDYYVGNPLTIGEDTNIITTSFGALSPSKLYLHYGIDYSLYVKNSDGKIEANDEKKIYPLLLNDNTNFEIGKTPLGGNTIFEYATLSYNFKGNSYNDVIRTRYEHLSSFLITDKTIVKSTSTSIGVGGNTGGASTEEHLHLDVSTKIKSPWLDYLSRINGYNIYYKQSSSDNHSRYYYSPEIFNPNYKWKVNNANVYVELNKISK